MNNPNKRRHPSSRAERPSKRDQLGGPIGFTNKSVSDEAQDKKYLNGQFGAVPLRAISDNRLSSLLVRVLAAISYHDRLSIVRGRGAGCWAGNKSLAARCDCRDDTFSKAATQLMNLGYIIREQHPLNKRLRVYRVIFDLDHRAADQRYSDGFRPGAKGSVPPTLVNGASEAEQMAESASKLGQPKTDAVEIAASFAGEYIPHKREKIHSVFDKCEAQRIPILVGDRAGSRDESKLARTLDFIEEALEEGGFFDTVTEREVRRIFEESVGGSPLQMKAINILQRWTRVALVNGGG